MVLLRPGLYKMITDKKVIADIVQWDIENWGQCIPFWDDVLSQKKNMLCLELGARNGGLSLLAALYGHHCVCSDIEDPMPIALPHHKKYQVENLITYKTIDIADIPYKNTFDVVLIKSVLPTMVTFDKAKMQPRAVDEIYNCLKPGGYFLFAENLEASPLHHFARKKFVSWAGKTRYLRLEELPAMLNKFSNIELKTSGFSGAFGRNETQRHLLAKTDRFTEKIIPDKWKYLVFGKARK